MAARKKTRKTPAKKAAHPRPANSQRAAPVPAEPIWQGNLRLSLVSCPVALYGATSRASDISFHLLIRKPTTASA